MKVINIILIAFIVLCAIVAYAGDTAASSLFWITVPIGLLFLFNKEKIDD